MKKSPKLRNYCWDVFFNLEQSAARSSMEKTISAPVRPPEARRPPLPALALVRRATDAASSIGVEQLCDRIYNGVLLKDKRQDYKQKFWVDDTFEKNCFLLLAKKLSIIWINDERYWDWINEAEECFSGKVDLPAAKLLNVCWLEISGKFRTIKLSPETTYEVAFKVKMSKNSQGWRAPVNLNLTLPDGTSLGRMENLEGKEEEEWIEVPVGSFVTTPKNFGEIKFSFTQTASCWKSGLTIKGVVLRPKETKICFMEEQQVKAVLITQQVRETGGSTTAGTAEHLQPKEGHHL
ncbi:hypothetical protein BT93_H2465 [Corymbia citriodora subsp. variegata]|nr:hypothetical protein BT93_H2465 [Corymbia citriodora subsp. variegata]